MTQLTEARKAFDILWVNGGSRRRGGRKPPRKRQSLIQAMLGIEEALGCLGGCGRSPCPGSGGTRAAQPPQSPSGTNPRAVTCDSRPF